ncbi:MAG: response regulator [Bacteroidales bacterium]|nr:response regulator [Bacteroidales bacterium]
MKRFLILLALLACLHACHSGRNGQPLPHTGDGPVLSDAISNQKVNAFAEDGNGHIWIATFRGLNKYNIHEYHQYFCTEDELGLPDNQINDVHCGRDGHLWVATVNGAAFRTATGEFQRIPYEGNFGNFRAILESPEGKILMSNANSLFAYDPETASLRTVIADYNAFGLPAEAWVGDRLYSVYGRTQLKSYNSHDFSLIETIPLPFNAYHICHAGNGEIWLSGVGRLHIFDTRSGSWKPLPESIRRDARIMGGDVDILFSVDDNTLLLNVIGKGMFCWQRSIDRVLFQDDPGFPYEIPSAEIRSIFKDSRGNLWFGTVDQGYTTSYHYRDGFNNNKHLTAAFDRKTVVSLCRDNADRLWIATMSDGLWVREPGTEQLRRVNVSHLVSDAHIGYLRCGKVFCDAEGDLWLLFSDKYCVVRSRYVQGQLAFVDSFFFTHPAAIAQDDLGRIWVGGGSMELVRYDKASRSVVNVPYTDQSDWAYVSELMLAEPGRMLVAANGTKVLQLNTNTGLVSPVTLSEEESKACIRRSVLIPNVLFRDGGGDIWVGTIANGLLRHDSQRHVTEPVPGAPCSDICAIQEDRQGNIWVSTMYGLGKYDRTVNEFVNYYAADGIGGNQFSDRAACLLSDGTLIFGGTHGLTVFNPIDVSQRRTVPLVFEDLKIHNQLVEPGPDAPISRELSTKPDITLRPDQNGFSISFAALDYSEHERSHYYYMMDGFDRYWIDAGNNHEAYYANLPAGKYTFRVRITNNNRSIVETEESLPLQILPPWYRSWWGRILLWLLTLVLLFGIWLLYRRFHRQQVEQARHIREEREQREKAQQEKEQEQRLNKIQMNYFSNVAHEFRTPLTMIAGPVSELAESEGVTGRDRKLVGIIQRNANWMLSLVGQLLDFNRIGNNKLQLKVAKTDVVAPLQNTVELFRFNAHAKNIELTAQGLEEPLVMWADVDKVQKITMNLLSNAMKYTPSGGKVTLSFDVLPREELTALFPLTEKDTDHQYACIAVADSGNGIDEQELEKIFERFYRSSEKSGTQGSGIGLFYARALTSLHHGYLKAWNRPEGGSVFRFILPVSGSSYTEDERTEREPEIISIPAVPDTAAAPEEENGQQRLIAVVDDDVDVANYVKVLLQPSYRVNVYFDADSALAGMATETPDLVISDVVMPGKSGYELCEAIKGDLQLSHIPVILVTAKVAVENQVQGLAKGADAYVTKPFQPAYLLALVKSLLSNRDKMRSQLGSATSTDEIEPEALSPRDAAFMKQLYDLMEKELDNTDLDITRITEMMHISRTKFYYKVKGLTGENPSVFFKRYKLNRAADLLKEGKYNMSEIAYMTGFNTLSHFSTSFKKQFGVPPSEYVG